MDDVEATVADVLRERKVEETRRKKLVASKLRCLQQASSAQLLFLMDSTGSMQSHIAASAEGIRTIQQNVMEAVPRGASLQFSFVGYRDVSDAVRFEKLDFTEDSQRFSSVVSAVRVRVESIACEYHCIESTVRLGVVALGAARLTSMISHS